ncbi:MAG: 6-carboxytetrahydropterin synthase [Phycisphaerae bacterium]|nr:6-carboxytetrahydropterin synthase [Phycisphaerae bacterium]
MFELSIESRFSAAHAIRIGGTLEPLHGHDWLVTLTIAGDTLDQDGLLCDFHSIEEALRSITGRFHNRCLNDTTPFDSVNPTAEHVAAHIAERIAPMLPAEARVVSVRVTEAPGCAATFRPRHGHDRGEITRPGS